MMIMQVKFNESLDIDMQALWSAVDRRVARGDLEDSQLGSNWRHAIEVWTAWSRQPGAPLRDMFCVELSGGNAKWYDEIETIDPRGKSVEALADEIVREARESIARAYAKAHARAA